MTTETIETQVSQNVHPTHEASIPSGDLKKATKGRQPRSREASTRYMLLRATDENVKFYRRRFERNTSKAKTYIDPDIIPEGVVTLWARQYFKGMPDSSNLRNLEYKAWKYATPDMFPSLAFMDDTGHIDDSSGRISNNEYYLMYRERFIHDLEQEQFHKQTVKKNNSNNIVAGGFSKDAHPYGGVTSTGDRYSSNYNDTYASSHLSQGVMQDHLK